jgi:hypothetical protein
VTEDRIMIDATPTELRIGAICGVDRRIASLERGSPNRLEAAKSDWSCDIDGANAEQMLAKQYGVYWQPTNGSYKAPDVLGVQIRSTPVASGHLITNPSDTDMERPYVLVITPRRGFTFVIAGWMMLKDTMRHEFWTYDKKNDSSGWWVPQERLIGMSKFNIDDWRKDGRTSGTDHDRAGGNGHLEGQRSGGGTQIRRTGLPGPGPGQDDRQGLPVRDAGANRRDAAGGQRHLRA